MKLPPVVFIVFALLLMISAATVAEAGVSVSGIHTLVSAEPSGEGSMIGFRLKITNTGDTGLLNTRLSAKDPLVVQGSPGSEIDIPSLAAGDSITLDITIVSELPPDQLRPGLELPLNFDVSTIEATGAVTTLSLVSEGGTP